MQVSSYLIYYPIHNYVLNGAGLTMRINKNE